MMDYGAACESELRETLSISRELAEMIDPFSYHELQTWRLIPQFSLRITAVSYPLPIRKNCYTFKGHLVKNSPNWRKLCRYWGLVTRHCALSQFLRCLINISACNKWQDYTYDWLTTLTHDIWNLHPFTQVSCYSKICYDSSNMLQNVSAG